MKITSVEVGSDHMLISYEQGHFKSAVIQRHRCTSSTEEALTSQEELVVALANRVTELEQSLRHAQRRKF
jgi:hypothetical protein